ncbi:MAG: hypothetical protein ACTHKM_06400 [Tsuneonella sp.]
MQTTALQKHLFYGTLLILLFLGTLSAVFRSDIAGKIVTVVCAAILFGIAVVHYVGRHKSLP